MIPSPAWKRPALGQPWYAGDTLNTAIGQGYVLVPPIQAARMLAAVANGGTVVTPHAVVEVRSPAGQLVRSIDPRAVGEVQLRPETLATIREGSRRGRDPGNGVLDPDPGARGRRQDRDRRQLRTASPTRGSPGTRRPTTPTLVVVAMVENAGYGAEFAGPIVQRVFEAAFGLPLTPLPRDPPKP